MENYYKGSQAVLKEFAKTKNAFPIWKISNIGKASVMDSNLVEVDPNKSYKLLEESLTRLPDGSIFLLSMFNALANIFMCGNVLSK